MSELFTPLPVKVADTLTNPGGVSFLPLSVTIGIIRLIRRLYRAFTSDAVNPLTLSMLSSVRDPDTQQVWSTPPADGISFACSNSHARSPPASSACKSCATYLARVMLALTPPPGRPVGTQKGRAGHIARIKPPPPEPPGCYCSRKISYVRAGPGGVDKGTNQV
jgi:hypothetical protein